MPNPIDSVNTANAAKEQSKNIQHIVVVGGGSAGWITAGTIAAKLNNTFAGQYSVTLVESANVAPIGVGEGTWPTMRTTLKKWGSEKQTLLNNVMYLLNREQSLLNG